MEAFLLELSDPEIQDLSNIAWLFSSSEFRTCKLYSLCLGRYANCPV